MNSELSNHMSFSLSQIEHLADLACLKLTPAEKKRFRLEISAILDYVNQLKKVETAAPKISLPIPAKESDWREDKIEPATPETIQQILENAPAKEGRLFKVKAVFE